MSASLTVGLPREEVEHLASLHLCKKVEARRIDQTTVFKGVCLGITPPDHARGADRLCIHSGDGYPAIFIPVELIASIELAMPRLWIDDGCSD